MAAGGGVESALQYVTFTRGHGQPDEFAPSSVVSDFVAVTLGAVDIVRLLTSSP